MKTHRTGKFSIDDLKGIGKDVIIEDGVRIFHPETVILGDHVYIGHDSILHGYPNAELEIGSYVWIGPQCYMHSAGGILIEDQVGIGPNVNLLTSYHNFNIDKAIRLQTLIFKPILLKYGCDIGIGSVINPGVTIGKNTQIGSGSVVTKNIPDKVLAVGNPTKVVRNFTI